MANATTLDDIAESIADLSTTVADELTNLRREMVAGDESIRQEMHAGFAALRQEIAAGDEALRQEIASVDVSLRQEIASVEVSLRQEMRQGFAETNRRLDKLELAAGGLDEDVRELYKMVEKLRKDFRTFTAADRDRFAELEAFAVQVAEKTGIPFNPKSKRQS